MVFVDFIWLRFYCRTFMTWLRSGWCFKRPFRARFAVRRSIPVGCVWNCCCGLLVGCLVAWKWLGADDDPPPVCDVEIKSTVEKLQSVATAAVRFSWLNSAVSPFKLHR